MKSHNKQNLYYYIVLFWVIIASGYIFTTYDIKVDEWLDSVESEAEEIWTEEEFNNNYEIATNNFYYTGTNSYEILIQNHEELVYRYEGCYLRFGSSVAVNLSDEEWEKLVTACPRNLETNSIEFYY